jgi:HSP20 family protein
MATDRKDPNARNTAISTPEQTRPSRVGGLTRREPFDFGFASPFSSLFQRWNDEMDRMLDEFGLARPWRRGYAHEGIQAWSPQVEVVQRGNDLVVRADLPGLSKDDVHVDIADNVLTIQGERKQEQHEEKEGFYRNERTYGSFFRSIPLPEGTISDSAKATFKNGVLEIVLQAPPQEVSRGRRLEIKEG